MAKVPEHINVTLNVDVDLRAAASALDAGMGATLYLTADPMDICSVEDCDHRRYWHNGFEGSGECSRIDCLCMAGRFPTDVRLK